MSGPSNELKRMVARALKNVAKPLPREVIKEYVDWMAEQEFYALTLPTQCRVSGVTYPDFTILPPRA